ncbi:hypothetical protein HYQ45_017438 [Verticillium longisporum]|uniref:Uncharacterized protein n=1 Tax=Verticillium longisporum TaxID=100787 RepID=A0A8I2Z2F7_VERLO|nr:hypothetical protein HYQ45_017438 [Verticillium longisporum]
MQSMLRAVRDEATFDAVKEDTGTLENLIEVVLVGGLTLILADTIDDRQEDFRHDKPSNLPAVHQRKAYPEKLEVGRLDPGLEYLGVQWQVGDQEVQESSLDQELLIGQACGEASKE